MSLHYHTEKATAVPDVLSRMSMCSLSDVPDGKKELVKKVHSLVRLEDSPKGGFMVHHNSESSLVVEVKSKQHLDPLLMELKESFLSKFNESFSQGGWDT